MLEKYYLKFYKKCKKILDDGKVSDKEIDDLEMHEARRKSIAFTFGEFNQQSVTKNLLIKFTKCSCDDYRIYLSRSRRQKDPLSVKTNYLL